jgi:hypothetical protein
MRQILLLSLAIVATGIQSTFGLTATSMSGGDWNTVGTWIEGFVPDADDSVVINAGHSITLSADASCIHLTISGDLDISGDYEFTVSGTLTMVGAGTLTSDDESRLTIDDYDGVRPRFVIPDDVVNLRRLTLNRANGASSDHNLDLDDNVPSAGYSALVLTNGILYMTSLVGNDIVYLRSDDIEKTIACGDANHVDGRVSRDIEKDAGWHTFPVGDSGYCRVMDISSASNGVNRESIVQFFRTSFGDLDCNASLPGGVTDRFYWTHEKVNAPGAEANVSRRIYFVAADDFPPGYDTADLRIGTFNTGPTDWGAVTTNWLTGPNYIEQTVDNASNNENWTFGSVGATLLPIDLLSFYGEVRDNTVILNWSTALEINNDFFTIERTRNGITFEEVGEVDGSGTIYVQMNYSLTDEDPIEGTTYYRLKQTDFDGAYDYADMISVNFEKEDKACEIDVSPNPCRGQCVITLSGCEEKDFVSIGLYDLMGRRVSTQIPIHSSSGFYIDGMNNLAPGTYIVMGATQNEKVSKKVIVQWINALI